MSARATACLGVMLSLAGCGAWEHEESTPGLANRQETRRASAPPAIAVVTDLAAPESVLHDPQQDVYFISNMNGGLLDRDGNGFISRVDAKTLTVSARWIESGRGGVTLDAPKGMTVLGDVLFVADVDGVRRFDRRTGKPLGVIALPGATLINDVTNDGRSLYVTDTGVVPAPGVTFASTGTAAIWKITGDEVQKLVAGENLQQPNGIDFRDGKLWVAGFGGSDIYCVDGTSVGDDERLPRGQLDGLTHLPDGSLAVTSWMGTAVYVQRGGEFEPLLTGIPAPADIGVDAKRNRLLVPRPANGQVTIHNLGAISAERPRS